MNKIFLAIFLLILPRVYALPVGNPTEASLFYRDCECEECCTGNFFNWGVGFYGDYVFNRHMETVRGKDIDTTKIFTNAAYLVVGFCERFDVFTTLGATRLSLNTSLAAFSSADPHPLFEIESGTAFSYSVGARVTLYQYRCLSLGVVGQYFSTTPNLKRLYIAAGAVSYADEVLKTRYTEWQIALGVSYRYNEFFVPYFALKYAHSHWRLHDGERFIIETNTTTFLYNLENKKHWGFALGLTLCPFTCEKLAVTAEARFFDEKALYINGQMRF